MQRRGHEVDLVQRHPAHHEKRGRVQGGERHALAGAGAVSVTVDERVHGLHGLGLPVRNDVGGVLIQAEVAPDIDVEIVLVSGIAEEGVALADGLLIDERREPGQFLLLGGQAPGVEVEVELVVIDDELFEALHAPVNGLFLQVLEPGIFAPGPHPRRHDVGQHQAVQQVREDEDLHVGQGHRGGKLLEFSAGDRVRSGGGGCHVHI